MDNKKMQVVISKLKKLEKQKKITIGAAASIINEKNNVFLYNENILFPAASIIKIFPALAIFDKIKKNRLQLEKKITLKKEDKIFGSSLIADLNIKTLSIYNLLYFLLAHSDNTAQVLLEKIISRQEVKNFFNSYGLKNFLYLPYKMQTAEKFSCLSPLEMHKIFHLINENKIIGPREKKLFLSFLRKTRITHLGLRNLPIKINTANPEIIDYYSKSGLLKNTTNDCLLLRAAENKLLNINIFITGLKSKKNLFNVDNEGAVLLGELSLYLYKKLIAP